jgi:hypothetical protein
MSDPPAILLRHAKKIFSNELARCAGKCNTEPNTKGHPMKEFYNQDVIKIDEQLFDTVETAIKMIERDWRTWTSVGQDDDYSLIEVVRNDDGDVVVRYFNVVDYDDNGDAITQPDEMTFEVELTQMMVLVA